MSKRPPRGGHGGRGGSVRVRTARGRRLSSTRWLERQLNDPYVQAAQRDGYRSRAAYKLLEMDERFGLLRPGQRVVDLGAAPGGWCQVAQAKVGPRGRVIGIDVLEMDPLAGVEILLGDLQDDATLDRLLATLDGPADLVLSDMAAATTGHAGTDHLRTLALAELAHDFARRVLSPEGAFVSKVFQGGTEGELLKALKADFAKVRHVKPPASRKGSPELYVVATGFRRTDPGG